MKYEKSSDGKKLNVKLIGEINAINIAEIEENLLKEVEGVTDLTFDMSELEYLSSSGLRMLLQMQKMMKTQGSMVITNANADIMEIFRVTGFVKWLKFA